MKTKSIFYTIVAWMVTIPILQLQAQFFADTSYTLRSAYNDSGDWWERDTLKIDIYEDRGLFTHFIVSPTFDEQYYLIRVDQKRMVNNNEHAVNGTWEDCYRSTRTNDERGNRLTDTSFVKENNLWVKKMNVTRTYDNQNNLIGDTWQKGINNVWVNNVRHSYTYDEKGNKLTTINEDWRGESWKKSLKISFTYDKENNLLSELWQGRVNDEWEGSDRYIYTYDINNNLLSKSRSLFGSGSWKNDNRKEYTYDEANNMLTNINLLGNENGDDWVNSEKTTFNYHYSESGKVIEIINQEWINGSWETKNSSISTYNIHGNQTEEIINHLKIGEMEFFTYTYDDKNNLLECLSKYKIGNADWIDCYRDIFTYDENGNCTMADARALNLVDGTWVPWNKVFHLTYNNGESEMSLGIMFHVEIGYHKQGLPTAINTVSNSMDEIKIGPNPAIDYLNITYTKKEAAPVLFKLYNISGTLIKQFNSSNGEKSEGQYMQTISLSNLSKGTYILQVQIGEKSYSKKFIKL